VVWAILNRDQQAALREITKFDSDRVMAILGGAMLDDSLRRTLEHRFRPDEKVNENLFKVTGALGNLRPKIDLAYQLYMIEKPMRNTMYGINEIRNTFAHNMNGSLNTPDEKLQASLKQLTLHETERVYKPPSHNAKVEDQLLRIVEPVTDDKTRFIVNLKICLMWLMGDFSRHIANSNVPN
jgi:hypothetical protein